jgi:hypothetical protein
LALGLVGFAFTGSMAAFIALTVVLTVGEMVHAPGSMKYLAIFILFNDFLAFDRPGLGGNVDQFVINCIPERILGHPNYLLISMVFTLTLPHEAPVNPDNL